MKFLRKPDAGRDLIRVLLAIAAQPDSLDDLQTYLGSKFRHLIQTDVDRIGADAVGYFGELGQILRDLLRRNMRRGRERRLLAAERRVGDALELGVGIDRRARKRDRRGKPPPHR